MLRLGVVSDTHGLLRPEVLEKLDPIPVYEMTWRGYKKLFPDGEVLFNVWDDPIEKMVAAIFDEEDAWYGEDFMFKTSNFDDTRFPFKEHIIGIRDDENDAQLAISKEYIKNNDIMDVKVGEKNLVIYHYPSSFAILRHQARGMRPEHAL